jgi:hypothetical protein
VISIYFPWKQSPDINGAGKESCGEKEELPSRVAADSRKEGFYMRIYGI